MQSFSLTYFNSWQYAVKQYRSIPFWTWLYLQNSGQKNLKWSTVVCQTWQRFLCILVLFFFFCPCSCATVALYADFSMYCVSSACLDGFFSSRSSLHRLTVIGSESAHCQSINRAPFCPELTAVSSEGAGNCRKTICAAVEISQNRKCMQMQFNPAGLWKLKSWME